MKTSFSGGTAVVMAGLAALALGCASSPDPDRPTAADSTTGVWPGTISHDDHSMDISYAVRLQRGRSTAQVVLPAHGEHEQMQIPMRNLTWDGTNLGYEFTTPDGQDLNCQLVKQSDTLMSGNCWGADGQRAMDMTMSPPPGQMGRL